MELTRRNASQITQYGVPFDISSMAVTYGIHSVSCVSSQRPLSFHILQQRSSDRLTENMILMYRVFKKRAVQQRSSDRLTENMILMYRVFQKRAVQQRSSDRFTENMILMYRVFKKELYNGIPSIIVRRVLRKRLPLKAYKLSIVVDSLYTFKCKYLRNTRHTATFAIPLKSLALPVVVILSPKYSR
jgi:hypothetical protein